MTRTTQPPSRRTLLAAAAACLPNLSPAAEAAIPVIDIHQHTNYSGRTDADLLAHQRKMGVARTVLLPGGFLLGGVFVYGGDPGLGVLAVPFGAVLFLLAALLLGRASARAGVRTDPARSGKERR